MYKTFTIEPGIMKILNGLNPSFLRIVDLRIAFISCLDEEQLQIE